MIEPKNKLISILRQCELLKLSSSSYYYQKRITARRKEDEMIKQELGNQYIEMPFYGVRRQTEILRQKGKQVGLKRVRRLLSEMGLETLYPKKNLSKSNPNHKKYPYLLSGRKIDSPNQVWSTDITYIPLRKGFLYLVAVIDWHSRYVLSWKFSNSLDVSFCLEALESSLEQGKPEIFNTDQGSQFTSREFTSVLESSEIQISMDGRGRALDNVFVERLWRSLKYEEVFLNDYEDVESAKKGISKYLKFYNTKRIHQSLNYETPEAVHFSTQKTNLSNECGNFATP